MDPQDLHYYQLRYDSHDLQLFLDLQSDFDFLNVLGCVYGMEYKQDGTKHLQMMIANEHEITQNEKTKIREALKKKLNVDYRNPASITTANYPHALLNYCQKVKDSVSTFTQEQEEYIRSLPLNSKKDFKSILDKFIKKLLKDIPNISKIKFYTRICGFYIHNDRSLPRKQQLLTLAVKYDIIPYHVYLSKIDLIWDKGYDSASDVEPVKDGFCHSDSDDSVHQFVAPFFPEDDDKPHFDNDEQINND